MSEKIRRLIIVSLLMFFCGAAYSADDDYILGLNAFNDGLYTIAAGGFERYVSDGKDSRKLDYSRYLLYRIYLKDKKYEKSYDNLQKVINSADSRFDKKQMKTDNMILLTQTDCKKAGEAVRAEPDDLMLDIYMESKCPVDEAFIKLVLEKAQKDETRLKAVNRVADKPDMVKSIFGTLDLSKLSGSAKRYFAVYFYQNKEYELFWKIRDVYEDADVVTLELDRYWTVNNKDTFLDRYEKYRSKYSLGQANACRAIEQYNTAGKDFDCNLVNECITEYTVDFVKIKGACLAKSGNAESVTEFMDSLGKKIFPGMCGYGEYIYANGLYTGSGDDRFNVCGNRYKIADILAQKGEYSRLAKMFKKTATDTDRYYAVIALNGLGKTQEAVKMLNSIKDASIKAKLTGGAK